MSGFFHWESGILSEDAFSPRGKILFLEEGLLTGSRSILRDNTTKIKPGIASVPIAEAVRALGLIIACH